MTNNIDYELIVRIGNAIIDGERWAHYPTIPERKLSRYESANKLLNAAAIRATLAQAVSGNV